MEAGADIQSVKDGIYSFSGVQGRFFSFVSSNKSIVIDDSYNANDTGDETTRRHHASLLLTEYILNIKNLLLKNAL